MIDKKYDKYVFALIMGTVMSCIMSFIITFINLGFVDNFFFRWMEAFYKAAFCAIPIIAFVAPRVRKIVNIIVKQS
ncbi:MULTISPECIES: DUF2798 domain-containing protein [Arcobacteraceae]|uniref:DUF2798 domain-containing protein n=3 Tax=Arcobacteraceae TaxID=2808963 RepID=A0A1C0B7S3_9BACT|nr:MULTISPECIES: DUF2798 domain-containing protein [Arcobacteraceae]OCL94064.1 hypothetical protein AAX25_00391 [Aliarcobacter thereius]OCL95458.1 hypothetical protein AA347_00917 [Aliarcobacter thereius LMG 24486]OCL96558.1 hypothetical protein AAX27_00608 [Aliarcobacter thereius]OCL99648.1 hypothetical protein AAX29_00693 [Aliarcobacter thereius]QBF16554.1 hypothetical membrane protein (DUF2798 domain) [Aliarcobacter thereius LMG 24486]